MCAWIGWIVLGKRDGDAVQQTGQCGWDPFGFWLCMTIGNALERRSVVENGDGKTWRWSRREREIGRDEQMGMDQGHMGWG